MAGWKRAIATKLADACNLHIVRKGNAGRLLEEDLLTRVFKDFEVDCVFDIGANIGQYGSLLRRLGFRGLIVSFEPIPAIYERLRKAAARDRLWITELAAIDEIEGSAAFNVMAHSAFSSFKKPDHTETALFEIQNKIVETIAVKTMRLEDTFARYQQQYNFRRPFLKMDTQGNDLAVARSAGSRLTEFVAIQSELAIKKTYAAQDGYREAIDFYERTGFTVSGFFPNTDGHFPDLIETDCIFYNPRFLR